jgi:hypothetical protein
MKRALGVLSLVGVIGSLTLRAADDVRRLPAAEAERLFADKVWPLLQEKCLACHGADEQKRRGKLDLRTRAGMLRGGASGEPALAPGRPERSPLYHAVTRQNPELLMPPKENDRLTAEQVEWIRQWIQAGAPWATTVNDPWNNRDGIVVATSGGRTPEWTNRRYQPQDLWAYQPIRRPIIPGEGLDPSRILNPIDAFIQAKLHTAGLKPAPPADRRTLLRRATFDLTGLPPAPETVAAFEQDDAADAYERQLHALLQSPHYGEQMARHWLDVVRYADTSGFSNDYERPHAWRYRDYIIRSFTQDKPYDRFILEQFAGDELEPENPECLIAVGFLRMGPWEHTGMTVAAVTRQQYLDDVTHQVGVTLLAQGLRCASCHDHKFDPIPTRDYYRLQAVFASTQFAERGVPFQPYENTSSFAAGRQLVEQRLQEATAVLGRIRTKNDQAIAALLREKGIDSIQKLPREDLSRRDNIGLTKEDLSTRKVHEKRRNYFERELLRYDPHAFSVYSGPPSNYLSTRPLNPVPARRDGAVPAVRILTGGSLEAAAEAVTPGVLSAVAGSNDAVQRSDWNTIPETTGGRRLALARWIASPQHPLTARVIVNRVWQWHFGTGLVATPNNFGKMGARPTHPELLDWLATWFVEEGWSLKKLHRLIMTTAVYRQSSTPADPERLERLDPKRNLLACFPARRLSAEEIRDSMLAVTGELNRELGGPGVFPEIHWEVAFQPRHIMGSVAPAYQPSPTPAERNRRTIYAFRHRTLPDPMLEVLNRPGSEVSCDRRDETTVTPQVFALFNGSFVHHRALAFAVALERQADSLEERVALAFRHVHGRLPGAEELRLCREHVVKMTDHHRQHPPTPTRLPTRIQRHMVEEMTGEDFFWEEELDVLKRYQRDRMPWEVGPETRALAELCLVLLNANEFLYLR